MDELHMQRLAALAEVAVERSELPVLMAHLTDVARSLLPATGASLLLWDADQETFTVSASTLPRQRNAYVLRTVRTTGGASRWIVDTQEPLAVYDAYDDQFGVSAMLRDSDLRAYLGVPLLFEGESLGVLYALDASPREYSRTDIDFMVVLARRAASAIGFARLLEKLEHLARTDELTGLNNRREFLERGKTEFERARRNGHVLSAIILDVDRFKEINDRYGHLVGDAVLSEVAERCSSELRSIDLLGRIGGEEFAALLPEVDLDIAVRIAGRIRRALNETPIRAGREDISVTVTLGVGTMSPRMTDLAMLLEQADAALYAGKAAGRDRVAIIDDGERRTG
jgi:diguanylate cyclase (GGDEF)-like protein